MTFAAWTGVMAVATTLAVTLGMHGRARRADRRERSRGLRRAAHYRAWQLVFGRRRNLRLAHHRPEETEPRA